MKKLCARLTAVLLSFALLFSVTAVFPAEIATAPAVTAAEKASSAEVACENTVIDPSAVQNAAEEGTGAKAAAPCSAKNGVLTQCGGDCEYAPSIVVHGIGQSELYELDKDGNIKYNKDGKPITAWPPMVDVDAVIEALAWPLIFSLITQKDCGLSDRAAETVKDVFASISNGPDGMKIGNSQLVRYPQSLARCTQEEKDFIYKSMPLNSYTAVAGEDHMYYFAYDSLGNNLAITEELYDFIQHVKQETGHDKVNLVPISLGGTIADSLFEFYPEVYDDLNRVVYIVPAVNGSAIVGDIYTGNLSLQDHMLYRDLLPSVMDGYTGYLVNIALRLLPKDVLRAVLDKAIGSLLENVLVNCTMMWGLVPGEYYDEAAAIWLSGPEKAEIKRQTDLFHQAQTNYKANILKLIDRGIEVFNIVDYNYALYSIAGSWQEYNADGIIHLDSTSMGAVSGYVDTPLPDGYVQQRYPEYDFISPDGIVDASAGLLPFTTWYFRNQDHERTGGNDVIIKLATELMLDNNFDSVFDKPDRFPQFNEARDGKSFIRDIERARMIDQSALDPEDAAELQAAIDHAQAVMDNTVVVPGEYEAARERLFAIEVKIGMRNPPKDKTGEEIAAKICKFLSDVIYAVWGPKGFSDWGLR